MTAEEIDNSEKVQSAEPSIAMVDENGQVMIEELAKEYLSKGAWQTIMFLFKERDQRTGEFGEIKVGIRRYQKIKGVLKQRSKFNISSKAQAKQLIAILEKWYPDSDA
jgi:hypothetical protein